MEEFELSSADINDLDGIQFCVHAKNIDLSDNNIIDLSLLAGLRDIEELNLSYNKIGIIDELSNLTNLKNLYLADNPIDDISPLFVLEKLEYIDLSDNKIDPDQIKTLVEMGIEVTS
jgi:Leucine-rich repeat (LRR) protein